jgi:hypothetical protein
MVGRALGGTQLTGSGDGAQGRAAGSGTARPGARSYARVDLPFGPAARLFDTTFTMFEVDATVDRYPGSGAPVYPSDLERARIVTRYDGARLQAWSRRRTVLANCSGSIGFCRNSQRSPINPRLTVSL